MTEREERNTDRKSLPLVLKAIKELETGKKYPRYIAETFSGLILTFVASTTQISASSPFNRDAINTSFRAFFDGDKSPPKVPTMTQIIESMSYSRLENNSHNMEHSDTYSPIKNLMWAFSMAEKDDDLEKFVKLFEPDNKHQKLLRDNLTDINYLIIKKLLPDFEVSSIIEFLQNNLINPNFVSELYQPHKDSLSQTQIPKSLTTLRSLVLNSVAGVTIDHPDFLTPLSVWENYEDTLRSAISEQYTPTENVTSLKPTTDEPEIENPNPSVRTLNPSKLINRLLSLGNPFYLGQGDLPLGEFKLSRKKKLTFSALNSNHIAGTLLLLGVNRDILMETFEEHDFQSFMKCIESCLSSTKKLDLFRGEPGLQKIVERLIHAKLLDEDNKEALITELPQFMKLFDTKNVLGWKEEQKE
jgi:hypothetical protein